MPSEVIQKSRNVVIVKFDEVKTGWDKWFLLSSDRHHDNLACRRDVETRHLEMVKERDAHIIDVGDLFCAMQGKYDPRSSMNYIRPEDVGADYLDRIVTHAAEFYGPYADRFLLVTKGNHESSILKRSGTDLVSNFVYRMNADYKGNIVCGEYGGWVRFQFKINGTQRSSINLKYFHGSGGGGPVTRGVIQTNRQAVYLPDADIVVNGHTHDQWVVPISRERFSNQGVIGRDTMYFIRTGTYKDEYGDGSGGWHIERGAPPKPIGAAWLHFFVSMYKGRAKVQYEVMFTPEPA